MLHPEASSEAAGATARVALVALNLPLDREFDYLIPEQLRGQVPVGGRLYVPFRNRGRVLGYCVKLKAASELPESDLKEVIRSLDAEPVFTPSMLKLARWMADYYQCSLGEALHAALPAAVRARGRRRQVQFTCLEMDAAEAERQADAVFDRSPAQAKVLRALTRLDGEAPTAELLRAAGVSRPSVKALARRGLVRTERRTVEPEDPLSSVRAELQQPPVLTSEQRRAYELITGRMAQERFDVVLLHGITSSGKTEVYLQCIARLIERGKQAIVLVPEISLTPQTVRHFAGRFRRLAVLHSRLTESERRKQWHRIRAGDADVVIGARSAIFAPVPALGLLVIDEEHENTFKQDNVPRYHARDVGIMRALYDNALVVLGSATPSLESYHNCQVGKYTKLELTHRIGGHPLPPVDVVDMREEWAGRAEMRTISRRLEACMRRSLEAGQQVILFINRRGYSPFIHCPRCGFTLKCRRCDITLNYHRGINVVECHYCGYQERPPRKCPECGSQEVRFGGTGTERVEQSVRELFPQAGSIRMDSDTTKARRSHEEKLEEFRAGRAGVLIGTQMVAKGLDFPNVTTVGVVNADVALHLPDFRSRERTFQLLAQVAGRTGRGPAGGRVVVQTFMPQDPSIRTAALHDYEAFARQELPLRRELGYPPFGRMARVICRGRNAARVERHIADLAEALRRLSGPETQVLGPAPAPVAQVRGFHRRHLLLKSPEAAAMQQVLHAAHGFLQKAPSGVKVLVDVDPMSML